MNRTRQRGFSLLEVLVAFAILALTLGVLMNIFARASRAAVLSGQYSQAAALAESKLNALGTELPLEEGTLTGEPENGFAWEITVIPIELEQEITTDLATTVEPTITPYRLTATVLWQDGAQARRVTFVTLRFAATADVAQLESASP